LLLVRAPAACAGALPMSPGSGPLAGLLALRSSSCLAWNSTVGTAGTATEEVASMMCTVIRKLGKELEPAAYPVNVNFVHRVLVKTDTGVEARADISDRLYEKVEAGDRLRFLDTRNIYRAFPRVRAAHRTVQVLRSGGTTGTRNCSTGSDVSFPC